MRNKVHYEWDVETMDEHGDVLDHFHCDTAEKALDELDEATAQEPRQLVLVRDEGNEEDGITNRTWAYVKDGQLPIYFQDENFVPVRFHKELQKALGN